MHKIALSAIRNRILYDTFCTSITFSRHLHGAHHLLSRCQSNATCLRTNSNLQQFQCLSCLAPPILSYSTSVAVETGKYTDNVFDLYHQLLVKGAFKPDMVIDFATTLRTAVYSDLHRLPWLHSYNNIISYMQILMNKRVDDLLTAPLYKHKHFELIYDHICRNMNHIPLEHCPGILVSLLFSGLEKTDPIVPWFLDRCYDFFPRANMKDLGDMTNILQSFNNKSFPFAEKIIQRLEELISSESETHLFSIIAMCTIHPVCGIYMSQSLSDRCVRAMLAKVQVEFHHLDIFTIGNLFYYVHKMRFHVNHKDLSEITKMAKTALDVFDDYNHLQSFHIAGIAHNAKRLGIYTGDVVNKIQARSLALLRGQEGPVQIRDITNLLYAFKRDISPSIKKEIIELLMQHLDNADVLILSNVADIILYLGIQDPDLMSLYQWKIQQNIENILLYITRLLKVLRLLRNRLEFDEDFNKHMSEVLLKHLYGRQGYDPTFVVVVSQYILPNMRTMLPSVLMECLLNVIPRCDLSLVILMLKGIEKRWSWSRTLHNQVLEIRSCLQNTVGEKIKSATHASQLAYLIRGLHIKSQQRDFLLLDSIMEHYPNLTGNMSREDYLKSVRTLKCLAHPYYQPLVFEDFIAYAKKYYSDVGFPGVLDLVNILANAGYRPQNFEDFSTFAVQVLEDAMEEENYNGQITLAFYLSILQIFPDAILGQIFTFDYLEEIDSIIEAEPDQQLFLRNLMMHLNRSVILECPHLDVPWFHAQYCREQEELNSSRDFQKNLALLSEVQRVVLQAVGGPEYVGQNVYSQYYHPIDFKIVLDSNGRQVSQMKAQQVNADDLGYQRIALQVVSNQQLCSNSIQRRGQYLRDCRHLEILGYRVEEVPKYEWNSMALSDESAKLDYIRHKIFRDATLHQIGKLSEYKP